MTFRPTRPSFSDCSSWSNPKGKRAHQRRQPDQFYPVDWVIVVGYLLLSVGVAFFVKRYAGNMTNFVSAGRPWAHGLGIATLTGTEMGLITVMYSAQKGFTSGFAGFHIGVIAGIVAFSSV
ncbi:MAG: hypothetical protein Ct9H300mP7_3940 [Verrucomicrobiota bacterium]|nr:MAG: hypothetical protein Ct9H300mP7_3940 [Verrucomicrobiota bacterium]